MDIGWNRDPVSRLHLQTNKKLLNQCGTQIQLGQVAELCRDNLFKKLTFQCELCYVKKTQEENISRRRET